MTDPLPPVPTTVRAVPTTVRAARTLLVGASALGLLLAGYAAWTARTVPAGVGPLLDSLTQADRDLLSDSWVLHPDQPVQPLRYVPLLIWLGLSYLVFPPLAYLIRRRFPPARPVIYLFGLVLAGLAAAAMIVDDDPTDLGVDRLTPDAHRAWLALLPPGYQGVHDAALVGMIGCVFLACLLLDRPATRRFLPRRPRRRAVLVDHPRRHTPTEPASRPRRHRK